MTTDSVPAHDAEELIKPISFRIAQRRADLGGIQVESSAVDYWGAVHVVEQLLKDKTELSSLLASARADERERIALALEAEALNQRTGRAADEWENAAFWLRARAAVPLTERNNE